MTKRFFLTALFASFALLSLGQRFGKTVSERPGLVSYTLRDSFGKDVAGTLDKIKAMGITNLEMSNLFGKTAAEMRALFDERGMRCTSYGVGYDDMLKKPETVMTNAKALGARYVRVAWIPHEGKFSRETARKAAEDFNTFGKYLRENGLQFCYHNHGYEFQPDGEGTLFDYLVAQTNPDYVNFEMDIAWTYLPGQDPAKLLLKYPKRFKLMHLKDVRKGVAGNDQGKLAPENSVALGTGQLDLNAILKAARKSSVEFLYIEDESPAAEQQVPQSLAYLQRL